MESPTPLTMPAPVWCLQSYNLQAEVMRRYRGSLLASRGLVRGGGSKGGGVGGGGT